MNTSNPRVRALGYVLALFLLCFGATSYGQRINALTLSTFSGFSSIDGQSGKVVLASPSGSISGQYNTLAMPFAFKYDDQLFASGTTLYVQLAGSASFTSNTGSGYNNILTYGTPSTYNTAFAPLSGLMYSSSAYPTRVQYHVSGVSPNRVLTIEWYNFSDYSNGPQRFSFQLKLYETSYTIEFLYSSYNYMTTNSSYCPNYKKGVGLNGRTSPSFIQRIIASTLCQTPSSNYRFSSLPNIQLATTPKSLNFGPQLSGTLVDLDITVSHPGTEGLLNITSVDIQGTAASDFSIVSPLTPPTNIAPGGQVTYTIRYTAQTSGNRAAGITFYSNGRDSGTQSIALSAFGIAPDISVSNSLLFKGVRRTLGESIEQSIVISSNTSAPLSFLNYPNSFVLTGDAVASYEVVRMPPSSMAGGTTDTLTVRFRPTVEGAQWATLWINSNAGNITSYPIQLRGQGVLPRIVVTPEVLKFDSVALGTTETKTFTVYNPGSDTLRIAQNFFSSADQDFTLVPLAGADAIVPPEKTREVSVTFRPLQKGTRVARYQLLTNIPFTFEPVRRDTATNGLYFEIAGTGIPVGSLTTDLGDDSFIDSTIIGTEKCEEIMLSNVGDADVTINSGVFQGTNAGDYTVKGVTYPFVLKAKSSIAVQICGTPAERGSRLTTLLLSGVASDKPVLLSVGVDVKGLLACMASAPSVAFETAMIAHNHTDSAVVTVTNCGDVPTNYTASVDATEYTVTPANSGEVAAGGTATFTVYFTPIASGLKAATLTLASTNAGTQTVALQGTGACAILDPIATVSAPETPANSTNNFQITINNSGNLAWTPGVPTITPNVAFTYVGGGDTPIPAGGSGVLNFTFNPPSWNQFTAVITFPNAEVCGNALEINVTGPAATGSVKDVRTADGFILEQNAPNPSVNGMTSFKYTVPTSSDVRIVLADVTGKTVQELVNSHVGAGTYGVEINTTSLASGTYLYIMEAGNARLVRQLSVSK